MRKQTKAVCERCHREEEWPLWLVPCAVCGKLLCSRCASAYLSDYICFDCRVLGQAQE